MGYVKKSVRMIQIMRMLQDRCYSTEELAEEFDVSPRTIRNDLMDIQADPLRFPLISRHVWSSLAMEEECMYGAK